MKKLHLAIATNDIEAVVKDYRERRGFRPVLVIPNEYALWRNGSINLSVRQDPTCKPGELRHLGWEDPAASEFTTSRDINGILWEKFNAQQQAKEINETWPDTNYEPDESY